MSKKILYFESAGMEGTQVNDVENCRIRTAFYNNDGKKIYLELISGCKTTTRTTSLRGNKPLKHPITTREDGYLWCDFCHYITDDPKIYDCNMSRLSCERVRIDLKYTKENILKFVNENCNCSFEEIKILPWLSGYEVHGDNKTLNKGYNMMDDYVDIPERTEARRKVYNVTARNYFHRLYRRNAGHLLPMYERNFDFPSWHVVSMTDNTITLRSYVCSGLILDDEREKTFKVKY